METLNLIILGLIISFVALYYYRKYIVIEDNIEGFRSRKTLYHHYGVPNRPKRNTACINMIADDLLHIYVGRGQGGTNLNWHRSRNNRAKWVGKVRCCSKIYHYEVKNFKAGDRLIFYSRNTGGPGYFAGHIFWNGKYYPTNKDNFKIAGIQDNRNIYKKSGKRIGCFRDGRSRRLPYYGGAWYTHEHCRELAQRRGHAYYGLQYGGQCWTGTSYNRATSYGKLSDYRCTTKGRRNWRTRRTQRLGGTWANDIYHTHKTAKIDYYGNRSRRWYRGPVNKAMYGWCRGSYCARKYWLLLYPGSYGLKVDLGKYSHTLHRWTQYIFEIPEPAGKQHFCPHPSYTEFNPSGCKNPSSASQCYNSAHKNYVPDWSKCHNTFNVSHNSYDNNDFFQIIHEAFELSKNMNSASASKLPEYKKAFNGECGGKEWIKYSGRGDNKGSWPTQVKRCAKACKNDKRKSAGFIVYPRTGRCWCEAESSKTCKRYKNGYKRFDFTGNEEHKDSKNNANHYKKLLLNNMKKTINICCMILGNTNEYLDKNRCKAEHASLDIGKFTNLVKKALKELQVEKMKNGKNANQFLKKKFRESLHNVIFYARVVRGKSGGVTNDCKCLKFSAGGIKCTPC